MITGTADDLVRGALLDIGILAAGEDPQPGQSAAGLDALNQMADALGLERLMLFTLVRTPKTLASGTASYTIGDGANIDLDRPERIRAAGLIQDTGASTPLEVPIKVLDDDEYAAWSQKTQQSSRPSAVWYDRGFNASGFGLVYPLPIPNVGTTQLVLYTDGGQTDQFADLTTSYLFKTGEFRMLRKNLALELAPSYPAASVSDLLKTQAAHARRAYKNSHAKTSKRANSPILTGSGGYFDIDSGTWR